MAANTPDIQGILEFKKLRKKGRSYREISSIMNKPLVTLFRWNKYLLAGFLSTKDREKVFHN